MGKILKLIAPDGTDVEIDAGAITAKRANNPPHDFHPDAKSVLTVGGEHFAVRESLAEIDAMIAGG
jgi:hypothetical protein